MRDGWQMQRGACGTARCGHDGRRIFKRLPCQDVTRTDIAVKQVHYRQACLMGKVITRVIGCRESRRSRHGKANRLGHGCHGICRELTGTSTSAWAGGCLNRPQIIIADRAGGMCANSLIHILKGDIAVKIAPRQGSTAKHDHRRQIKTRHRHHHGRQ